MLLRFTTALHTIGFASSGESMEGHQHRWERDNAQIDVLIPTGIGERAALRKGVSGGTTIQAPGAQGALDTAEAIEVRLGDVSGVIYCPTLPGAIAVKAAAYTVMGDRKRDRHLEDIAILANMLTVNELRGLSFSATELRRLTLAMAALSERQGLVAMLDAEDGLARLGMAVKKTAKN